MNKIEFRVWNKETKRYSYNATICDGRVLTFIPMGTEHKDGYSIIDEPKDKFIIEQYTGLKDCNNIKLYEGDIVLRAKESNRIPKTTYIESNVIKWDNMEACFKIGRHTMFFKSYRKVGNINENTELATNET